MENPLKEHTVKIFRTSEDIKEIRSIWVSWQWFPSADIDIFLDYPHVKGEIISPYVVLLLSDDKPTALLIGRVEDTTIKFQIGYKTVFQVKARLLRIVHGGLLGDWCRATAESIIDTLLHSLKQNVADVIIFDHLPVESELHDLAKVRPGFLQRDYFAQHKLHWVVELPDSFEGFLNNVSKNTRRNIRRYRRLFLKKYDGRTTVKRFGSMEELEQLMKDIESIASQTYHRGLGTGFIHDRTTHRWLQLAVKKKWLRAYILYIDGIPCSFEIGLLYGGTFWGLYTGYDPKKWRDRPGTILLSSIIKDLCEDKSVKFFDFGFGDAGYKKDYGNRNWQEAILHIFSPTLKGIKLNTLYSLTSVASQTAVKMSKKIMLYDKIKTKWRSRIAEGMKSPST